jgi:DNA replication protein DnaC
MGYKSAYKEIMREYEAERDRAQRFLQIKKEELYAKAPRVKEIDEKLTAIGLSLARLTLAGDEAALQKAHAELTTLLDEKKKLMPDRYLDAVYRCAVCSDTGYIQSDDAPAVRCACLKQRLIEKYYRLSNLYGILEKENFDTFDLRYYSMSVDEDEGLSPHTNIQTIYKIAMQFVLQFDKTFQNLFLYGNPGLGKTFISNCIAKDLLDKGKTVLYITAPRLFKTIEDSRFNRDQMDEPDEMLEATTQVDLLILDDLGTEFSTIVTSSALFDIINQRLLTKKQTIISTNISADQLESQYSARIGSRFFGNFDMLKFFGDDIRIKKKYIKRG